MNNQDNDDLNPLEKQIEEINEWQKNVHNPGHFAGSGKASLPMRNMLKSPVAMLVLGIIFAVPVIYNLVGNFNIITILGSTINIVISGGLIIGGTIRLLKRE